ncbi:MAG: hypothetical protein HDT39_08160 [Lachnospiraceae bacterium]|nr:hypothetical protein [Lachnospiraceae bacterium]
MTIKSNILKYIFQNVYFINGTAYAGKSTMVKMLAEKYDGICCGENYHDILMDAINVESQPNLSYFDTMKDWQEFVNRTPEEYDSWISGCSEEASDLEIIRLIQLADCGKRIFVDTNISTDKLLEISDYHHVAIMLAPQSISIERFFDREDKEKQFILEQIQKAVNPEKTMQNYKECLAKVNSAEKYHAFENSGFFTLVRNDERTLEQTLEILEEHFNLKM